MNSTGIVSLLLDNDDFDPKDEIDRMSTFDHNVLLQNVVADLERRFNPMGLKFETQRFGGDASELNVHFRNDVKDEPHFIIWVTRSEAPLEPREIARVERAILRAVAGQGYIPKPKSTWRERSEEGHAYSWQISAEPKHVERLRRKHRLKIILAKRGIHLESEDESDPKDEVDRLTPDDLVPAFVKMVKIVITRKKFQGVKVAHDGKYWNVTFTTPFRGNKTKQVIKKALTRAGFTDSDLLRMDLRSSFSDYTLRIHESEEFDPKDEVDRILPRGLIPDPLRDLELMRIVNIDGYKLRLFDAQGRDEAGRWQVGYQFINPKGVTLFSGIDVYTHSGVDSNQTVREILGWLTLKPGDTDDDEYFAKYTDEQMDFAQSEAENLRFYALDPESDDDETPPPMWRDEDDNLP